MAAEDENALDDLLAAMDDENKKELAIDDKNSPVNESLYLSAFAEQTWLPNSDSPKSISENDEKLVYANLVKEDEDDATPTATPNSCIVRSKFQIQDEISSVKARLDALKSEMSLRDQMESAESLRRVSAVRSLIRDSPIDFVKPTGSTLIDRSEVHQNDSESSDDEEVSFGNCSNGTINRRIAIQPVDFQKSVNDLRDKAKAVSEKLRRSVSSDGLQRQPLNNFKSSSASSYDPAFGIHVINPKMSSAIFQTYVGDRQKVRLSNLTPEKIVNWSDWVTMGVLVNKSFRRKSAKGNDYLIWKLCDLNNCNKLVRLFIFGDECVDKLNNLQCGTVLALLNTTQMPKQDGASKDDLFSLKVDNYQKVLEIGSSPDYGYCKGIKKADGTKCTNLINKSVSEYCDFHLMSASKKFAAKRGEFQLNSNVPPKSYDKALSGLTTVKIMPLPGQSSSTTKKPRTADVLKQLSKPSTSTLPVTVISKSKASGDNSNEPPENSSNFVDLLRRPTAGSMNILKQISQPNLAAGSTAKSLERVSSCRQFLASYKQPPLVDAKTKAVAIIKAKAESKGGKLGPNKAVLKRLPINEIPKACANEKPDEKSPVKKRQRLGDFDINKEKLELLLAKKSNHEDLVEQDDVEKQEHYFKVMEAKEKVEQRATEVMELKNCKVVTCRTCDYTWHTQSEMCKQYAHKVLWHQAEKRFFKCKPCGKRTISYSKYPTKPCTGCSSTTFDRVAMREERKGPKLASEELKIRGDEEPFINL